MSIITALITLLTGSLTPYQAHAHPFMPFGFWKSGVVACTGWPCGTDGSLTVSAGTTTITAGSSHDYENLTINVGGALQILTGTSPTYIGVHGTLTCNGQIQSQQNDSEGGTFGGTAPDGYSFSYTIAQSAGGDGGYASTCSTTTVGSPEGGGGGGCAGADGGTDGAGGIGGIGNGGAAGGAGGTLFSGSGGNGADRTASASSVIAGSGGGGAKGYHGGGIYLKVFGTTSGACTVTASGIGGGSGGNGGVATNTKVVPVNNSTGGSGGGGGAGGSGGKIVARFHNGIPGGWTTSVTAGSGGLIGTGGLAVGFGATENGGDGLSGNNGSAGSTDIATY